MVVAAFRVRRTVVGRAGETGVVNPTNNAKTHTAEEHIQYYYYRECLYRPTHIFILFHDDMIPSFTYHVQMFK